MKVKEERQSKIENVIIHPDWYFDLDGGVSKPGTNNAIIHHSRSNPFPDSIRTIFTMDEIWVSERGKRLGSNYMSTQAIVVYCGSPNPRGHNTSNPILMLMQSNGTTGRRY